MKIVIGGDVSNWHSADTFREKDVNKCFDKGLQDLFKSADEVIVNLEEAVTESERKIEKFGPNIKGPIGTCDVLKDAGVTICGLSNNHIFDFGIEGVRDTLAELDRCELKYTGYGKDEIDARKDLVIERDGVKVTVIAVCEHEYSYALPDREGARAYDPYDTSDDIVNAKKNSNYVIVLYHGGKENCEYPSPRLVKACRSMIKHGADVVLCQHSHCIGCYEEFNGGHILYGQGNFHFADETPLDDTIKSWMWNTGFAVVLDFGKDKVDFSLVPVVMKKPLLTVATDEEGKRIFSEFEARNEQLKKGEWLELWRETLKKFPWYESAMLGTNKDLIAHYIDCEAHQDVVREIFKTKNYTNEK